MSSEGSAGRQRAENAPAYKSTPLRPAIIMTTVLVWALVVALIVRAPAWASIFVAVLTGASFLAFLVGYIYLFAKDRESLRTGTARGGALATPPDAAARGRLRAGDSAALRHDEPAMVRTPEAKGEVVGQRPY